MPVGLVLGLDTAWMLATAAGHAASASIDDRALALLLGAEAIDPGEPVFKARRACLLASRGHAAEARAALAAAEALAADGPAGNTFTESELALARTAVQELPR